MSRKLFVGNLSFETTDNELKELFSTAGVCESASVIRDRTTGRSRGFGFVEMSSEDEALQAVTKLNSAELQGRNINVSIARERTPGAGRFSGAPRSSGGGGGGYMAPPPARFKKDGGSRRGLRARKRSL